MCARRAKPVSAIERSGEKRCWVVASAGNVSIQLRRTVPSHVRIAPVAPSSRRVPPCPLSIAGGAPHARANLPEPATPNLHRSRAAARRFAVSALDRADPARLFGRRFGGVGTPPSSRYTAGAGGGRRVAASLCCRRVHQWWRLRRVIVNQWKRLRRGEYQWGPVGRCQHGQTQHAPTIPTGAATAGQPPASAAVAGSVAAASASAPACFVAASATLRRGGSTACAAH